MAEEALEEFAEVLDVGVADFHGGLGDVVAIAEEVGGDAELDLSDDIERAFAGEALDLVEEDGAAHVEMLGNLLDADVVAVVFFGELDEVVDELIVFGSLGVLFLLRLGVGAGCEGVALGEEERFGAADEVLKVVEEPLVVMNLSPNEDYGDGDGGD